jgi:hypothetical protein
MDAHYELIKREINEFFFNETITGDDVAKIARTIDDLIFDDETVNNTELLFELQDIIDYMWSSDYKWVNKNGETQNWDKAIETIVEYFKNGYERNEENLNKLLVIILNNIQNDNT